MSINPILKHVGTECNLRCKYCFYSRQRRKNRLMKQEVLEAVISEFCKCNPNNSEVKFFWHGGEPLLAGVDFYLRAITLQRRFKKPNQKVINCLVTNGTLIDKNWANFFRKNKFEIGVSLDGPKKYHDQRRVYPDGRGSFAKVIKGIRILNKKKVMVHILSVITNEAVSISEEIVDFFLENQLYEVNFIPSIGIDDSDGISFENSVEPALYVDFLIAVFDLWLKKDNPKLKVLPVESIVRAFLSFPQEDCRFSGECTKSMVIDFNGDIFSCCTYGYRDFANFGNITRGIKPMIRSHAFNQHRVFLARIKEKCRECRWYRICKGGCPFHHYLGKGVNIFCQDFQRLFSHIEKTLKEYQLI